VSLARDPEPAWRRADRDGRRGRRIEKPSEALAILEEMQAAGTLQQGYADWIPSFRKALGLPTRF
jgi:hypothetical protein